MCSGERGRHCRLGALQGCRLQPARAPACVCHANLAAALQNAAWASTRHLTPPAALQPDKATGIAHLGDYLLSQGVQPGSIVAFAASTGTRYGMAIVNAQLMMPPQAHLLILCWDQSCVDICKQHGIMHQATLNWEMGETRFKVYELLDSGGPGRRGGGSLAVAAKPAGCLPLQAGARLRGPLLTARPFPLAPWHLLQATTCCRLTWTFSGMGTPSRTCCR